MHICYECHFPLFYRKILLLGFAVLFVDPIGIPKVDGMLIQNFLRGLGFPDLFKLLAVNKE